MYSLLTFSDIMKNAGGVLAAMTRDNFITSFRAWAGNERRQHTVL